MRNSLLAARQDLFDTVEQNLNRLNDQLVAVTGEPTAVDGSPEKSTSMEEADAAATAAFVMSQTTQTTPNLSRQASGDALEAMAGAQGSMNESTDDMRDLASRLLGITHHDHQTPVQDLSKCLAEFEQYLRGLDPVMATKGDHRKAVRQDVRHSTEQKRAFDQIKQDIRSMKGRLLSAGSFPSVRHKT